MMIEKALHHDISDVFVPRENDDTACTLVRDGREDRVKNRVTIDGHPHNTSPPLVNSIQSNTLQIVGETLRTHPSTNAQSRVGIR